MYRGFLLLYTLFLVSGTLDSLSTIKLIKDAEGKNEINIIPQFFHNRFGVKKGETLKFVVLEAVMVPFILYYGLTFKEFGFELLLFLAGIYLGFGIKQFLSAKS